MLKIQIKEECFHCVNFFIPNTDQVALLDALVQWILKLGTHNLIRAGDLNVPLVSHMGISSGKFTLSFSTLAKIRDDLASLQVGDVRQVLHPTERGCSYFSYTNNSYSRLDYFFSPTITGQTPRHRYR